MAPAQLAPLRAVHQQALLEANPEATVAPGGGSTARETQAAAPERHAPRRLAPLPRPGEHVAGCVVERELARGAMGAVYVARDELGRRVALKVLLDGASQHGRGRFALEAQAGARFQHPGIVRVHTAGVDEAGRSYLVMELVEGESLAARLEREGPLEPHEAARCARELALALACAHAEGIVHRDLKPQNVLVHPEGRLVLTDFGLARVVDQSQHLTQTGQLLGTPAYMPPEQARGEVEQMGPRSDVYSLGAVLYSLLTGAAPFGELAPLEQVIAACRFDPDPPSSLRPDVPPELDAIVLTCMEKSPARRYASAEALANDLAAFLSGERVEATRRRRRRVGAPLAAAALALAGVVALGAALRPSPAGLPAPAPATSAPSRPAAPLRLDGSGQLPLTLSREGRAVVLCRVASPGEQAALSITLEGSASTTTRLVVDAQQGDAWDEARYRTGAAEGALLLTRDGYPPLETGQLRLRLLGQPGARVVIATRSLAPGAPPPRNPLQAGQPLPPLESCFTPRNHAEARSLTAAFRRWLDGSLKRWVDPEAGIDLSRTPQLEVALTSVEGLAARDPNPRAALFAACLRTRLPLPDRSRFKLPAQTAQRVLEQRRDPYAHWLVGRAAYAARRFDEARQHLSQAQAGLPHHVAPLIALARAHLRGSAPAQAEPLLRHLVQHDPTHAEGQLLLGQALLAQARGSTAPLHRILYGCLRLEPFSRRPWPSLQLARALASAPSSARREVQELADQVVRHLAPRVDPAARGDLRPLAWIDLRLAHGRCLALSGDPAQGLKRLEEAKAYVAAQRTWKVPRRMRWLRRAIAELRGTPPR